MQNFSFVCVCVCVCGVRGRGGGVRGSVGVWVVELLNRRVSSAK